MRETVVLCAVLILLLLTDCVCVCACVCVSQGRELSKFMRDVLRGTGYCFV
jgi:hypothetical protein